MIARLLYQGLFWLAYAAALWATLFSALHPHLDNWLATVGIWVLTSCIELLVYLLVPELQGMQRKT